MDDLVPKRALRDRVPAVISARNEARNQETRHA